MVDVLAQYNRFVKPAYDDFIKPTMKHADIIVPFSAYNNNAINMLVQNLKIKMYNIKRRQLKIEEGLALSEVRNRIHSDSVPDIDSPTQVSRSDNNAEEVSPTKDDQRIIQATAAEELPSFELVDISVDYGRFKGQLNVFEAGNSQNHKIYTLILNLFRLLRSIENESGNGSVEPGKDYMN